MMLTAGVSLTRKLDTSLIMASRSLLSLTGLLKIDA